MHSPIGIISDLKNCVADAVQFFSKLSVENWDIKSKPDKWSRQEILGHLCDSAMNNLRRFVVSQYEQDHHIVYEQNEWVRIQQYQQSSHTDIIQLWQLLNIQIIHIFENLPEDGWQKTCITDEQHTILYLATDYVNHLSHHINQIKNYD